MVTKASTMLGTPAFTLKLCPEVTAAEKQVCVLKARMSTGEAKGGGSKNPPELDGRKGRSPFCKFPLHTHKEKGQSSFGCST